MRRFAKAAFSWATLTLGVLLGLLMTVDVGRVAPPHRPSQPDWLMSWFEFVGVCLLGSVFLIASVVALRNRRRAGALFLASAPIVALCFAYSGSVFEVTGANGTPGFYLPRLSRVVVFWLLFFLPFLVPLLAKRRPKRALVLFLFVAAVGAVAFALSPWSWPMLMRLLGVAALLLVFGGIWLGTHKLRWPPLVAPKPRSARRRLATVLVGCLLFASLDIAATFAVSMLPLAAFDVDCAGPPLFSQPMSPQHAVFTAQLIRVGHSRKEFGRWTGEWAIGRIQHQFWGLRWPARRFVFLTGTTLLEGEAYFVDGARATGVLTRFLPIVNAGPFGCNRTGPEAYAALELRLLREPVNPSGSRILGYARRAEPFNGWQPPMPFADAKVSLTGSNGISTVVTTDKDGIYEADGLPPDDYTIKLAVPSSHTAEDATVKKKSMIPGALIERNFAIFWNGTIEGTIVDGEGDPAHAWVVLQHPDGTDLGPYVRNSVDSDKNGSFRIERIPPGSYKLTVNPAGPSAESPYAPVYYPAGGHSDNAGVLKIIAGQHIQNVDFVVNPLSSRKLRTRVTWPDGKPVEGAWVYVAYEHTPAFESLRDACDFRIANHDGVAELLVFGESRIRVFAVDAVNDKTGIISRYSAAVEVEIARLPPHLDLVVSASKLPDSP